MKHIYRFIIADLLVLGCCFSAWGQNSQENNQDELRGLDGSKQVIRQVDDKTIDAFDTTKVYHGCAVKLDIGNTIIEVLSKNGNRFSAEVQANVNLRNKYFPAIEAGYARCDQTVANDGFYKGSGGFGRLGADLSILKNSTPTTWRNYLMVGLRLGGAVQKFELTGVSINDKYWNGATTVDFTDRHRFDLWGEVTLGTQVEIVPHLLLGWSMRLKLLFTRGREGTVVPWYVPGFGRRDNSAFGFNYYIGYR
ncbi:MAG: hypothetical protein IJ680_02050, partial [Paludibacteraceae bacterium]|nr:hypothetical protein [Paludibacteraceae bacterium]